MGCAGSRLVFSAVYSSIFIGVFEHARFRLDFARCQARNYKPTGVALRMNVFNVCGVRCVGGCVRSGPVQFWLAAFLGRLRAG